MSFNPDEILDLDFAGVEPAAPTAFVLIPSGEYQLQCTGGRKYNTGQDKDPNGVGDTNKPPNIEFNFQIINHPLYQGMPMKLSHNLGQSSRGFLLNTLMCLIPDKPWQNGGIKVPIGQLLQAITGRTANAVVFHDNFKGEKGIVYTAKIKGLKVFDATVPPPMPSDTNPPKYMLEPSQPPSPVQQQAAGGVVSPEETANFLNQWPGGSPDPATPKTGESVLDFGF